MTGKNHFSFEKLDVYQKALLFGEHVIAMVRTFPKESEFNLKNQFVRAADSIALNIAEGYPGSDAQFINHLNIAIRSANECVACSTKARLRDYIGVREDEHNRAMLSELTKMLSSLRRHIRSRNKK